jgi:hypothetical protein
MVMQGRRMELEILVVPQSKKISQQDISLLKMREPPRLSFRGVPIWLCRQLQVATVEAPGFGDGLESILGDFAILAAT